MSKQRFDIQNANVQQIADSLLLLAIYHQFTIQEISKKRLPAGMLAPFR
jgi:hypothetical protein